MYHRRSQLKSIIWFNSLLSGGGVWDPEKGQASSKVSQASLAEPRLDFGSSEAQPRALSSSASSFICNSPISHQTMTSSRPSQVLPPKQAEPGSGMSKTKASGNAVTPDYQSSLLVYRTYFYHYASKMIFKYFCRKLFFLKSLLPRTLVYKSDKSEPIPVEGKEGQSPTIFPPSSPGKGTLGTQFKNLCSGTQFFF